MIVTNAKVYTGNPNQPAAQAFAVAADTILAVGDITTINQYKGKTTKIIDAKEQLVIPGFIDCHVHFMNGGFGLSSVKLRDAKTPEEFAQRIKSYAETVAPGTWITEGN